MFLIVKKCEEIDTSQFTDIPVVIKTLEDIEQTHLNINNYKGIIILGGDGTLLRLLLLYKNLPFLIPINYGTLGFLTTFSQSDLENKNFTFDIGSLNKFQRRRLLLNDKVYFINETVITSRNRRLNTFHISIKNKINNLIVRGDSLIISTMTGSTAYNHSINGPALLTDDCYLINVVAPCKSFFRPLVCNLTDDLEIFCNDSICLIDGKEFDFSKVSIKYDGNFVTFLSQDAITPIEKIVEVLNNN